MARVSEVTFKASGFVTGIPVVHVELPSSVNVYLELSLVKEPLESVVINTIADSVTVLPWESVVVHIVVYSGEDVVLARPPAELVVIVTTPKSVILLPSPFVVIQVVKVFVIVLF